MFSLVDFVDHFEAFIVPQADMRIEARNLDKFNHNYPFASTGRGVPARFPSVIRPYVTEAVLVMTYERATPMNQLLADHGETIDHEEDHRLFRARGQGCLHDVKSRPGPGPGSQAWTHEP